ncbi:MAG: DNA recombination protein RmuC [Parcubacteria group bacterium]|nr:DNA recombination protein RmuC [Parcubacteria group bacterium]
MDNISIIFIILGIIAGAAVAFFFVRKREAGGDAQGFLLLQQQLNMLTKTLDERLGQSHKHISESMGRQFSESQKLVKEVTEELTLMKETGRQMVGSMEKLQELQDILKNPKQRGILGEYYLEAVLKNVLPPGSFQMQYAFKDGSIVDAVVFVKDKIIPIDSKFSLENYTRLVEAKDAMERERLEKAFKQDLKNRIDETAQYVKPTEGTLDFAFMFIPHEAIYYDLLISQVGAVKINTRDLVEYAFRDKKVIIVSPTSFLAYLQTVLQGLKALQIEEQATEIIKRVGELGRHIDSYDSFLKKLGVSLKTTVSHYSSAYKEFKKIDKDVVRITGKESSIEPLTLEKPIFEEE